MDCMLPCVQVDIRSESLRHDAEGRSKQNKRIARTLRAAWQNCNVSNSHPEGKESGRDFAIVDFRTNAFQSLGKCHRHQGVHGEKMGPFQRVSCRRHAARALLTSVHCITNSRHAQSTSMKHFSRLRSGCVPLEAADALQ